MARVFNKFSRLVLVAALAGLVVPCVASAGDRGGRSFSKSFHSRGGSQVRKMNVQPKTRKNFSTGTSKRRQGSSHFKTNRKFVNPSNIQKLNRHNTPAIKTLPIKTGGSVIKKGPIGGTGKPFPSKPVVRPFPGGQPPVGNPPIDPGPGNGHPGGNCPPNGGGHCKPRCPWPIFWPIYGGGSYNGNCYNNGYCPTPTVIVNEQPPVVVNEVVAQSSAPAVAGSESVDLVLEDLEFVEPATMLVGPAYRVKFRNQGLATAGGFRVGIVAALNGQADEQSPMTMVDVAGLASGESAEVTVRLPRTAMQLASTDGQTTAFTHLLVAADFDNLIGEVDKTNNVAIVERAQLEVAAN